MDYLKKTNDQRGINYAFINNYFSTDPHKHDLHKAFEWFEQELARKDRQIENREGRILNLQERLSEPSS